MEKSFYSILEVPPDADYEAIRESYRNLVLKWHPDVSEAPGCVATERMLEINEAWLTLKEPRSRQRYDLNLFPRELGSSPCASKSEIPPMVEVNSRCVDSLAYDGRSKLYLRFRQGAVYVYYGVKPEVYQALINAASIGEFLLSNVIHAHYRYRRVWG